MNIEAEKKKLEQLTNTINSLSNSMSIEFHQQNITKKHMSFTGGNGRLCIHPTSKGFDIGLSRKSLSKEMYAFMCVLSGKDHHDKYGFPAEKTLPKWEVDDFEKVKKAAYHYAGLSLEIITEQVFPEEVIEPDQYLEGTSKQISVNIYERNPKARKTCLEYHGYSCKVCDFNFEKTYGAIGKDFIHVHHLIPLSKIKEEYKLNPETDLVPMCPNCHAMIHRFKVTLMPEQLIELINATINKTTGERKQQETTGDRPRLISLFLN